MQPITHMHVSLLFPLGKIWKSPVRIWEELHIESWVYNEHFPGAVGLEINSELTWAEPLYILFYMCTHIGKFSFACFFQFGSTISRGLLPLPPSIYFEWGLPAAIEEVVDVLCSALLHRRLEVWQRDCLPAGVLLGIWKNCALTFAESKGSSSCCAPIFLTSSTVFIF